MTTPLLSILIPTIPSRIESLKKLCGHLMLQPRAELCEILYVGDTCGKSIGEKRNDLLSIARGQYVAFVDDDDRVSDDYIPAITGIIEQTKRKVDVVTFLQHAVWDGVQSTVEFRLEHQINGPFTPDGVTKRYPWHTAAWKREIAQGGCFAHLNWGEDVAWVNSIYGLAQTEAHWPHILYYYEHTDKDSAATARLTEVQ